MFFKKNFGLFLQRNVGTIQPVRKISRFMVSKVAGPPPAGENLIVNQQPLVTDVSHGLDDQQSK